jgi:hypothetical protein
MINDELDQAAPLQSDLLSPDSAEQAGIDRTSSGHSQVATDQDAETTTKPQGRLSNDARRCVVSLLRHGVILASQKQQLFDALIKDQIAIKSHLADMFLRVSIDEANGVCVLLQQLDEDDEDTVSLITRRPLSVYDTLLLLVLRKHYQERETAGEHRIYIDIDRIESRLTPFLPLTNNSRSDRRKLSSALKKLKDKRLLLSVPGDDERFELTPVIRYVVNAEFLQQLLEEYQSMAQQAGMNIEASLDEA